VSDIQFWKKQVKNRTLINALRSHRERAIRFFGAADVFAENEMGLLQTLEAHEILATQTDILAANMNAQFKLAWSRLNDTSLEDADIDTKEMRFTVEHVEQMKQRAKERLAQALGKP
jgi:hypothetical protein